MTLAPEEHKVYPIIKGGSGDRGYGKAVVSGFMGRCPNCLTGKLFTGWATLKPTCDVCQTKLSDFRADDGPAYITICIVGLIIGPLLFVVDSWMPPSPLIQLAFWLPVTLAMILVILPRAKGVLVNMGWALSLKHDAHGQPSDD
ncbi:MAG: DUF983 domain-containing protein [Alphaproteobacteria bacterium]